ncbi:SRPBCC domain-containing protein [Sphingomonas sp. HITSZ_GF]|uniref:SRPBCC family protein n=1 Tax=Sphingomonas sp. HITSZ_GF TaxID=3037247 RepID=UPI00240E2284|nr:SRPBCC domain-containing protein [Sphingomonas sp. HITSZ_GF]MDG2534899.1 SRPBCC domain-containing protein [Sphingomonas sp. HITSZ_GF]
MKAHMLTMLALAAASPAAAEVTASTETSFTVTQKLTVAAPPAKVWAALIAPASWWAAAHSWSGDSANFAFDARPGGCWCEKLPGGGGVEHMRAIFVQPNKLLRLSGALGPFQAMPVAGVMTYTLEPAADGKSTALTVEYAISGGTGMARIAPMVDKVLGEQAAGLKAAAER